MTAHWVPLTILVLAFALAAPLAAQGEETVPVDAYALVDGVPILRSRVSAEAERSGAPPALVLEREVLRLVMADHVTRAGHDPEQVTEEQLEKVRQELLDVVSAEELAELDEKDLRLRAAYRAYVDSQLGEEALRAQYEAHKLELAGEIRVRQIQFPPTAQGLADAQAAISQLGGEATDEDVARMARERSVDPFGPVTGGDLDWFSADGRTVLGLGIPRSIRAACFARGEEGLIPYPVSTPAGYHVLWITRVRLPVGMSYARLRSRIRSRLARVLDEETLPGWRSEAQVVYADDAPRLRRRQ